MVEFNWGYAISGIIIAGVNQWIGYANGKRAGREEVSNMVLKHLEDQWKVIHRDR